MTVILGLNAYHGDAAAALLVDGELVAAAEEERFNRIHHAAGFPHAAAAWCLSQHGLELGDVDHVAVARDPSANVGDALVRTVRGGASARYLKERLQNAARERDVAAALGPGLHAPVHQVEHHQAHVASAFLVSPFDEAAILSVDGFGDFASTMTAAGSGSSFDVLDRVLFPHSLGMFYTAFSQWLGFFDYGNEGKAMGLAAYGDPQRFAKAMREVVTPVGDAFHLNLDYFTHDKEGVDMVWDEGEPKIGPIFSEHLIERFGPPRPDHGEILQLHMDVAAALQRRLEELYLHLIDRLHERTGLGDLCLAGGVALNAVANGRVRDESPFARIWIQPAAGDSGTAIGAAAFVWNRVLGEPRTFEMTHAYLGPAYEPAPDGARPLDYAEVAQRIADGAVVGWFQDRMEFGPRALGNRSIVADPRRADMKDTLNARIKNRESFRPFAPSILVERVAEWYRRGEPSPFMLVTDHVREDRRAQIPAVDHVDGTGRLQTVDAATNPRFHRLISEFERITGVPILLNTSFNENEPIVMTPEDALATFGKTSMDLLVLGDYVIER
jgi:carbamoyltransferase